LLLGKFVPCAENKQKDQYQQQDKQNHSHNKQNSFHNQTLNKTEVL
jgi:hypothetical protein